MEFYRMAGDVDYMLRAAAAEMASHDVFCKKLVSVVALKSVMSGFAMAKIRFAKALSVTALLAA